VQKIEKLFPVDSSTRIKREGSQKGRKNKNEDEIKLLFDR
jgi:hypothetical protein